LLRIHCLHWCVFPRIPTLWRHNKVIRHRKSCATLHHSCFRHLVSDMLLSLISMENTRNVR
jgi:hypothetical protein